MSRTERITIAGLIVLASLSTLSLYLAWFR